MKSDGVMESTTNTNQGDNQNAMDNLAAGGDIEQTNEIHQHYHERSGGTVISDPSAQNFWIDVCERVANLPISETKILATLFGSGTVGMLALMGLVSPWNGLTIDPSQYSLVFSIGLGSAVFLGFAVGYAQTDDQSQCPECGQRFALRATEVRKTGRTECANGPDTIHGKRDMRCRNCGFEVTRTDTWSPNEFAKLHQS